MSPDEASVLVHFHASWCGPCKTMAPLIKEVKEHFGHKLQVLEVDVDKNKPLATNFGIRSVPTMLLFKEGKQVWKQAGLISKRELSEIVHQNISSE